MLSRFLSCRVPWQSNVSFACIRPKRTAGEQAGIDVQENLQMIMRHTGAQLSATQASFQACGIVEAKTLSLQLQRCLTFGKDATMER